MPALTGGWALARRGGGGGSPREEREAAAPRLSPPPTQIRLSASRGARVEEVMVEDVECFGGSHGGIEGVMSLLTSQIRSHILLISPPSI